MVELKDTVELMLSEDYKERFVAEYRQVKIRLDKLERMLVKLSEGKLPFKPSCPISMLKWQCAVMKQYLGVLEERARVEGIVL